MRWSVALSLSTLLLFAACSSLSGAPTPQSTALDQPFTLKPGDTVPVGEARVQVGFERVTSDSRCPRDVQCIQAGEAAVRATVALPGKARQSVDVTTVPDRASATVEGYTLTLTSLEPVPLSARPTRAADYRATFVLSSSR
jgi:hypothetical protein